MRTKITFLQLLGTLLAAPIGSPAQSSFTKITAGAIVNDLGVYAGCAWGDFNNTGFQDLFVAGYAGQTNVLYRNNGNGTFSASTQGDPIQDADYHIAAAVGDYDNDGHLDLVVGAGVGAPTARRNLLYHNNGDGTFSRASGGSVTNQLGFFGPCAWADYDNDGFLDLFIANHGANDAGGRNLLFHNNGDGTFEKITVGAVVNDIAVGYDAMWADYDNDGFEDLLVINSSANAVNFLYHNNRDGTFTRVLTNAIATQVWSFAAKGAAWGDYDNDGFQDVFVCGDDGTTNTLYHNNGDGTFTSITSGPMSSRPAATDSVSCSWGDYDNDGYLDLFVTSRGGQNRLFHNNRDGTFTEILFGDQNDSGSSLACSWVDYDNDGFLDLFFTRNNSGIPISNLLYHNDGNTNTWLEVKLVGAASNRSGIGAKVRVRATIGGKTFWQMREINNGGGLWAQPLVAHFGLGDATNADTVRIEWPSGIVQTLTNVAAGQILTVVEHQSGVSSAPTFTGASHATSGSVTLSTTGTSGFLYVFEGSTNLVNWTWLGARSNTVGTVQFTDLRATNYPSRFYRVSIP